MTDEWLEAIRELVESQGGEWFFREEAVALLKEVQRQRIALRQIMLVAGNLPDERLTTATGPNDAVQRGLMVLTARDIAKSTLSKESP